MNRTNEEQLLALATAQREHFDEEAWLELAEAGRVARDEVAAAALFLAEGHWYGHENELFRVAATLAPGSVGHFAQQAKLVQFDCTRFDIMLKARLRHESRNA
jgi:hypothetical protein